MLWPVPSQSIDKKRSNLNISKEQIEKQKAQNKCFLEASKNGGMWFS